MLLHWGINGSGGTVMPGPQFVQDAVGLTAADFGGVPANTLAATLTALRNTTVAALSAKCTFDSQGVVFAEIEDGTPWMMSNITAEAVSGAQAIADAIYMARPHRRSLVYLPSFPNLFVTTQSGNTAGRLNNRRYVEAYQGVLDSFDAICPECYLYDQDPSGVTRFVNGLMREAVRIAKTPERVIPTLSPIFAAPTCDPPLDGQLYPVSLWRRMLGAFSAAGCREAYVWGYYTDAPTAAKFQTFSNTYGGG
jgi:hypothetical protein